MDTYEKYLEDNNKWIKWFNEEHKPLLKNIITNDIKLTGSRSFNLAYPASDLEYCIIVEDNFDNDEKMKILEKVKEFYLKNNFSNKINLFTTKAGLPLLIAKDTNSGMWKVEVTIREKSQQELIEKHISSNLQKWTNEEKYDYITNMEKAFHNKDEQKMTSLKKWLKILSE